MNKIIIIFLAALVSSCSTLPPQYSASPARILVRGVSTVEPVKKDSLGHLMFGMLDPNDPAPVTPQRPTWATSVQIRSIDGGEILWVRGYHLGDKVWPEPGVHKLSVVCSTSYSWGAITSGTDVDMNIQPGYTYFLAASRLTNVSDKAYVVVTKKESK